MKQRKMEKQGGGEPSDGKGENGCWRQDLKLNGKDGGFGEHSGEKDWRREKSLQYFLFKSKQTCSNLIKV
ncbi:hypothetical protein F2Q70_00031056 [Brassica cretica]|uniref:Uncharacterized protein n=1 Tax=Brassica cretica TaxID=69181 RepID=A0A8S9FF14_BRACR|nr:hypothetical protein F2Q70_00031056 [Brassica cretica]KAF3590389.1 hypothetical protein DY000_02023857 [Brassica cretica]